MQNYPDYDPGTKILVLYSQIYGNQPQKKITKDKNGKQWIEVTVVATWHPVFFPGYDVKLPNGQKVPIVAERTKPCQTQQNTQ